MRTYKRQVVSHEEKTNRKVDCFAVDLERGDDKETLVKKKKLQVEDCCINARAHKCSRTWRNAAETLKKKERKEIFAHLCKIFEIFSLQEDCFWGFSLIFVMTSWRKLADRYHGTKY